MVWCVLFMCLYDTILIPSVGVMLFGASIECFGSFGGFGMTVVRSVFLEFGISMSVAI
jgi:hypothetical protein